MKKIISISLVMIMLCSLVYATSGEKTYEDGLREGYREGYDDGASEVYTPKEPNVIFVEQDTIPEVIAGEMLNLLVEYTNDSSYSASSIKITPSFDDVPLVYERPVSFSDSKNLRANSKRTTSFSLRVKDDAKVGVYAIKFKVDFKNTQDEVFSKERTLYFKVTKSKLQSTFTINNIKTYPENVSAGQDFVLSFNVNNIGDVDANDVAIKLHGFDTSAIIPVDGNDFGYIGDLKAGTSATMRFNLSASKSIPKGTNIISANLTYRNSDNETVTDDKTIYILNVLSENESIDTGNSRPKIIIESYSTNPGSIVAGSLIDFAFKFKNTSKDKNISNMKIVISSDEGAFMIANGSNTFYIESLAPGASMTKSISLNVKQDLTSKSYPINVNFDYEDSSANSYIANETINIPVVEYSNLVINGVYVGEGFLNSETNLSFDYINMGKARASNLTASVEGDYVSSQSINYIGNLEAGNSDYYDIMVSPTKDGQNFGTLVLTFEDSSGKKIEARKEFSGFAMAEFVDPGMMMPGGFEDPGFVEPVKEPLNIWLTVGLGVGSLAVSFFITKIITAKIIRKKLEDEI